MKTDDIRNKEENGQVDGVFRKPSLIAGATKKMAFTYAGSAVCAAAIVIIDSLVAGVSIGEEALAAIAAAGPLLALPQILHCFLGFGVDKLMVQAIGEGKRREANRIFGAVLISVAVVFLLVFIPLILFERPLLKLILVDNANLVDMVVDYTVPLFATAAIFEVFLCIERAFRIDGRAKLFSQRSIVTNIANIAFDILLVSVLGLGVSGLAWASVISTLLGYTVSLSHFFSKKRTVSPDLSVIFSMKELLTYVKKDIRLGSSATLDEVMSAVALAAQTAAIGVVGGSGGLAIWAVYKSLRGVIVAASNGVSASVSVHAGLLYGQGDYDGVRYSIKEGIRIALISSIGAALLVLLLADSIPVVYGIQPEFLQIGAECLRIGCAAFPAIAFLLVVSSYLPAVDRVKLSGSLVFLYHGVTIIPAIFGYTLGLRAFIASYVGAVWFAMLVLIVILARDRFWFVPEHNPETIAEYSIQLEPGQISAMSVDAEKRLAAFAYPDSLCHRGALVMEECMNYIEHHNAGAQVNADLTIKRQEGDILLAIIDNGAPCNPIVVPDGEDWDKPGVLEAIIVLGFSADVDYDRVLDLNNLTLLVKPSASLRMNR